MLRKLAAVVAVPLLATACANEADSGLQLDTGAAAVASLRAAPEAAVDAGTARFEMTLEVPAADGSVELAASGAFDSADRQGSFTMDLGPLIEQLAGQGGLPGASGAGATVDLVVDGDTFYLRSPLFALLTDEEGWLSVSADEVGTSRIGIGATDPTALLQVLRGIGGEPTVIGSEEVRGVPTTHYRATVSLADALDEVPEANRATAKAAFEQLGDVEHAEVPVDVWVDGDDLPRRVRADMGAAFGALAGGDGAMTMTLDLFDYDEPVQIEVPPADQVTPAADVLPGLGGLLGAGEGS